MEPEVNEPAAIVAHAVELDDRDPLAHLALGYVAFTRRRTDEAGTGAIAQVPAAVAAPGETTVATFQGEGAQIYQCKAGNDGKLTWVFREPIATLILDVGVRG